MKTAIENNVDLHISGAFNGYWSHEVRKYMVENFTDISISFDGTPFVQNLQGPAKGKMESFTKVTETLNALDKGNLSYGRTTTYTLPCGSPIPAVAICTCNCVSAPSSGGSHTYCTCDQICTCVPIK